jgi:hypothetical protein
MNARQQLVMNHFAADGYPAISAAAVVGNGCQESGVNLDSTFDRVNADHGSGGFLEWRDSPGAPRKTRLAAFADQRGQNLRDDLGTQCDYCIWELATYFPALDKQLRDPGPRTIENLTANFMDWYENPAPATANLDNRIAHARSALIDWNTNQSSVQPQPAPEAPWTTSRAPQVIPSTPPVSIPSPASPPTAATAGRQAAVLEQMLALQKSFADEIAALLREKAPIDKMVEEYSKLIPAVPIVAPQLTNQGTKPVTYVNPPGTLAAAGKAAINSTTIWGSILAGGSPLVSIVLDQMGHSTNPNIVSAGSIIGALLAIYGRVTATAPVTGIIKPK